MLFKTYYCRKYSFTHPYNQIWVFQSLPWPQIQAPRHADCFYKHLWGMGPSQELSEFQRRTVIGCNQSNREISSLLNIALSTVCGIITKWKQLGMTATQPRSGRPRKLTAQGQWMLKRILRRGRQLSAVNGYRPPNLSDLIWRPQTMCPSY